jgi:hypothetical protein
MTQLDSSFKEHFMSLKLIDYLQKKEDIKMLDYLK